MAEVQLNWAEATVKEGALTVPLDGEVPKSWKRHFETTVKLLGHRDSSSVEVKKKTVRVRDVQAGEEDDLRFYLEGLVEQANAAETAEEDGDGPEDDEEQSSEAAPEGPDAELTDRFRSFAERRSEAESEPE